jgi:AraC-like DNA-binding protein
VTTASHNEILFSGEVIKVGRWRLPIAHPQFENSGPTRHYVFVFPRTTAWIQHAGDRPFVSDQNHVTFYNLGQEYRRKAIAPDGDRCEWYGVAPHVLRDAVREWDPAAADAPERILRVTHGPSDAALYLAQRQVYRHLRTTRVPDVVYVEETMIGVLRQLLARAYERRAVAGSPAAHADLVRHVRAILARHTAAPLTLSQLARACDVSVFHLCRVFRAHTGRTIHAYRNELRLRLALERVMEAADDLTAVALESGFSSHSHFTAAFRKLYGVAPSRTRGGECRDERRRTERPSVLRAIRGH